MDKDTDKLRFDLAHIEEKLIVKDKEYQILEENLYLKIRTWYDLMVKLLVNDALLNRMDIPKGGLDSYYRDVNIGYYGLGFDLTIDGIYQPDKSDNLKEIIPGVGNVYLNDGHRPGKEVVDEEYIEEFFNNGVRPRHRGNVHGKWHQDDEWHPSTFEVKPRPKNLFPSDGLQNFDFGRSTRIPDKFTQNQDNRNDRRNQHNQRKITWNQKVPKPKRGNQGGGV